VAGADEYRVDGVAFGACEAVAFKKAVAFRVTDDGLDGAATPQLPLDGRRSMAGALCNVDVGDGEPMRAVAFVDVGALDPHARQPLNLRDLILQRVAVIGQSGNGADAQDELAAVGARVGDGDGRLHAKFVARARLALGYAFDLGSMQGVDLVLVVGLLRQERPNHLELAFAGVLEIAPSFDLAFNVARRIACLWPRPWINRPTSRRARVASRR